MGTQEADRRAGTRFSAEQGQEGPRREPHPRVLEALHIREMLEQVLTNEGREVT